MYYAPVETLYDRSASVIKMEWKWEIDNRNEMEKR